MGTTKTMCMELSTHVCLNIGSFTVGPHHPGRNRGSNGARLASKLWLRWLAGRCCLRWCSSCKLHGLGTIWKNADHSATSGLCYAGALQEARGSQHKCFAPREGSSKTISGWPPVYRALNRIVRLFRVDLFLFRYEVGVPFFSDRVISITLPFPPTSTPWSWSPWRGLELRGEM